MLCARLGLWQLERLAQRRALTQRQQARLAQPPLRGDTLAVSTLSDSARSFSPAVVSGVFDFARQIVVGGRTVNGTPAVYITTPLRLANGHALLVERGWVYSPDFRTVDVDALREPDSVTVQGVLLAGHAGRWRPPSDRQWPISAGSNDPTQFRDRFPYPLARLVLRRTEQPPGSPAALRPVPLPPPSEGPHLSYAIQWFAFGVIALIGSAALFRRSDR